MSNNRELTVIIPTVASVEKSTLLFRAIQSIRDQDVHCEILMIANGQWQNDEVVSKAKSLPGIQVLIQAEGDLVKALVAGVTAVKTPLFSFLDDDDILLPNACRRRIMHMTAHPEVDVLVTPGEWRSAGCEAKIFPNFDVLDRSDILKSVIISNWLASCGGVYRRSRVGPEYFAAMPRYLEWTYLAFQIARNRCVQIQESSEPPHFAVIDTADSESKKIEYFFSMPANIECLMDASLPAYIKRLLSEKLARTYHMAASQALKHGMLEKALKFHLYSLSKRGGLKYFPFTRHLVSGAVRRRTQ